MRERQGLCRTIKGTEAISLPQPQRGTGNGTLARRDADGRRDGKQSEDKDVAPSAHRRQSKRKRGRRSPGKERGKSASGSAQRLRTLKERSGKECDPRPSRSASGRTCYPLAPCDRDRRPGRRRRPGGASPRRRDCGIERGAGMPAGAQSSRHLISDFGSRERPCKPLWRQLPSIFLSDIRISRSNRTTLSLSLVAVQAHILMI